VDAERLHNEYPRQLEMVDLLIVRPTVTVPLQETHVDMSCFIKRAPRADIRILYSVAFTLHLSPPQNDAVDATILPSEHNAFLAWLQQEELTAFVKHSAALFPSRPHIIYRQPSGLYAEAFLRVGSVQTSRAHLDAFFFWLLPYLNDRDALLTDTWSISSIGLNAALSLAAYTRNQRVCDFATLSVYQDGSPSRTQDAEATLRTLAKADRQTLAIISASASGRTLKQLQTMARNVTADTAQFRFVSLYSLSNRPSDALCRFPLPTPTHMVKDSDNRAIVEIDPVTYFPFHLRDTPVLIKRAYVAHREFFTRYQGLGVFQLHRDSTDNSGQVIKHHGLYIDVTKLLDHAPYRAKLSAALNNIPRAPVLIVAPPHVAGEQLAAIAQEHCKDRFGITVPVLLHPDLVDVPGEAHELITSAKGDALLLILDDVVVTGERIRRYSVQLRDNLHYQGRRWYLIGVARPESKQQWEVFERDLRHRGKDGEPNHFVEAHYIEAVEHAVLPNWQEAHCPWCREERHLLAFIDKQETSSANGIVIDRLLALQQRRNGLANNQGFWRPHPTMLPVNTDSSLFLEKQPPATDGDIIAVVAATLQHLRTTSLLEVVYPHITVIEPTDYLEKRFVGAPRLALLRAATPTELVRWHHDSEQQRQALVRERFAVPEDEGDCLRIEFAIATLEGKLPRIVDIDWETLHSDPPQLTNLMRNLLSSRDSPPTTDERAAP
jgi:hypothetical protein